MTTRMSSRELIRWTNCDAELWVETTVSGVNAFPCMHCNTTIIVVGWHQAPTHVKSFVSGLVLYFMVALSYVFLFDASYGSGRLMMSTLGVILLGLLFSVIVIACATDPRTIVLEVPASRPKCQRCGRAYLFRTVGRVQAAIQLCQSVSHPKRRSILG